MRKLVCPDIIATPDGTNLKVKRACVNNTERRFAEAVVMVVDSEGQGRMLRALFDSGCKKLIILKKFTESKRRTKLKPRDHIRYTTYGGTFNSTAKASVGLQFIEFEDKGKQTVEHEFSVDGMHYDHEPRYNVVIGSNLMWNMGVKIDFRDKILEWNDKKIPLKIDGALQISVRIRCYIPCT